MKKLITSLFILSVFALSGFAQATWNNFWVTTIAGTGEYTKSVDTMYVALKCRNGAGDLMCSKADGSFVGVPNIAAYAAGDSVTWQVVKGASLGTTPRVRFLNCKTGLYLYQGVKGGTTLVPYMAPLVDPYNGLKDFIMNEQGVNSGIMYYYLIGTANYQFYNAVTGTITVKSGNQGWKIIPKQGPQPKAPRYSPTVAITTPDVSFFVGGSVNLNIQVTKGANNLLGNVALYHNTTLVTTLPLDANGVATYNYPGLIDGLEQFTAVYSGDSYYDPENSSLSVVPIQNTNALGTKVLLNLPASSEFSTDAKLNIAVKTTAGDIVNQGNVYVYVNGIKKNRIAVDALGTGSITFNNLLVGTTNIKAIYIGDKMNYLNSDTARVATVITPTSSSVTPYPVYFDLTNQPAINKWASMYTDPARGVASTHNFPQDSVPGITMDSTKFLVTYNALKWLPIPAIDDYYSHSNNIVLPLGTNRALWFNIKTPWLNKGSYNVYLNTRESSSVTVMHIDDVSLDGKSGYFPNEELQNRWFVEYGNTVRRWNANAVAANNGMAYLGTVNATTSDIHDFKVTVVKETGASISMGMMQFIPVEMDSLTINQTAAVSLAKTYYPMFDLGGFARQNGEAAVKAFSDITALAIPYQVPDQTVYSKTTHVIDTLGNERTTFNYLDYVIVYRKDKWTRMAEGPVDLNTKTFSCDLPDGDYYYQELDLYASDIAQGTGRRTVIKDGTFTVGVANAIPTQKTSKIKVYGFNSTLTVKGIQAGAKIIVTDITGRVILNSISSSDVFTKKMRSSIYIVTVITASETLTAKVLVK